jgi:hypothetical protein
VDEKKHASTIFGNKCCFSGGRMCSNISNMIVVFYLAGIIGYRYHKTWDKALTCRIAKSEVIILIP